MWFQNKNTNQKKKSSIYLFSASVLILFSILTLAYRADPKVVEVTKDKLEETKNNYVNYFAKEIEKQIEREKEALENKEKLEQKKKEIEEWRKKEAERKKKEEEARKKRAGKGKYIDIDISSQTLRCYYNGKAVLGPYKVSTGKVSMPTPYGTFRVLSKTRRAYSRRYGLYMPYWMQFTSRGHGIHELPEWPSGYKEGANHLGRRVSHGCVRLGIGPAKKVYYWSPVGTIVKVHW
ncbi:hypothetical protein COY23_00080 [bacterium (Candidatus Torokbacteria) CG_4_10_14_0_2_um_filter_35_8]|nr:MAG: hypothetical protein COY23_00080 [bacterium (Candidatus Torokbacteria) CG_4_10_14_0_2_um_filter_35_8]